MGNEVKVCPACEAEYLAHIKTCRACEVELVAPSQTGAFTKISPEDGLVCVHTGPAESLDEFARCLKKHGIECGVYKEVAGKSCSSNDYGLFVPESLTEAAHERISEYLLKLYPETLEAEKRISQGLCPACGATAQGMDECPECGLNLSGTDCGGDDGCGVCG